MADPAAPGLAAPESTAAAPAAPAAPAVVESAAAGMAAADSAVVGFGHRSVFAASFRPVP